MTGSLEMLPRCIPTHCWHLLRHLPPGDLIVSSANDQHAGNASVLEQRLPGWRILKHRLGDADGWTARMRDWGLVPAVHSALGTQLPSAEAPETVLRELWLRQQAWQQLRLASPNTRHDRIIHLKAHLWMRAGDLPGKVATQEALTPWWGRQGGCNPDFALLGEQAAEAYFGVFRKLPQLLRAGVPLHVPSLLLASLSAGGLRLGQTLRVEYSPLFRGKNLQEVDFSPLDLNQFLADLAEGGAA